jgi:hypothetical protein
MNQWTPWTAEELPSSTLNVSGYAAVIQRVTPSSITGYANRQWTVTRDGVTIGTGYIYGSEPARRLCRAVLREWGVDSDVEPSNVIAGDIANEFYPVASLENAELGRKIEAAIEKERGQ